MASEKFDGETRIICPKCRANSSAGGTATIDKKTGKYVYIEDHCCDMCGGTGMVDIEYRLKARPKLDFTIVPGQILKAVANE